MNVRYPVGIRRPALLCPDLGTRPRGLTGSGCQTAYYETMENSAITNAT